ncbi:MAG: hypothetical protein M1818_007353 [Claussenomyces sp. TS43310]|nr:MAG: hypothetical protein M1818_007353 [Claussenomyces sp. TS43310]
MSARPRKRVSQACRACAAKKIKDVIWLPQAELIVFDRLNRLRQPSEVSNSLEQDKSIQDGEQRLQTVSGNTSVVDEPMKVPPLWVPPAEESGRLFQTYFACIHPIWPLLYKPLYETISYHSLVDELPRPLVYSIFAIAACIHPDSRSSDRSDLDVPQNESATQVGKASQYLDAALSELQCASDGREQSKLINALQPSIAHCQALTILALQQHGVAEFSRAGVLCSLAGAMAIDLRLHRDCWQSDPIQREVASRLWWNVFVLDKMISSEMGRPVILRSEEADAPYPSVSESDEYELFTPGEGMGALKQSPRRAIKMRTLSAFHTTIEMIKIMECMSREIYSLAARESIRQDRALGDAIRMKLSNKIREWERQVEASPLKLDLSGHSVTLPAIVTNYVVIRSTAILIHRPFVTHWQQHMASTALPPFNTADPSEMCFQAAKDICRILEIYSDYLQRLPCDLIFCIFTAAGTLLHHLRQSDVDSNGTRRYLRLCIYWLSVFGKNWKNAGERQKLLNEWYDWPANLGVSKEAGPPLPQQNQQQQQLQQQRQQHQHQQQNPVSITYQPHQTFASHPAHHQHPNDGDEENQLTDILTTVEDWGFLDDFGDATDNFYAMDAEFRSVLERQIIDGELAPSAPRIPD